MSTSNAFEALDPSSESPRCPSDSLTDTGGARNGDLGDSRRVGAPSGHRGFESLLAKLESLCSLTEPIWVELPGPDVEPRLLAGLDPATDAFVWEGADGSAWCGLGAAARIQARGDRRFTECRERGEAVLGRLGRVALDETSTSVPRLFGGFSFFVGGATDAPWSSFGDAHFLLPQIAVEREAGQESRWIVVLDGSPSQRRRTVTRLADVLERCSRSVESVGSAEMAQVAGPAATELEAAPLEDALGEVPAAWRDQVEAAVAAIAQGRLAKVVLSRLERFDLREANEGGRGQSRAQEESSSTLLHRLASLAPESQRFLVRLEGAEFLGATPERLVRLRGLDLASVALAGSLRRSPGAAPGELERLLLESRKDRLEHEVVVQYLAERLAGHCDELRFSATPGVRHLSHIVHLETPFRGRLRSSEHILELVALLHPTPAVGGRPVAEALRLIEELEEQQRGWYSGPVGWFDESGGGDFHVALRSFLLERHAAYAYAGGGIVADSDVRAEYAETLDKLALVKSVLGVREPVPALTI